MQQQGGGNRGCVMFLIIGAAVLFFMFSNGGLGGLLGGGQAPGSQAPGGADNSQSEGVETQPLENDGGLLEQVQQDDLEAIEGDGAEAVESQFAPVEVNDVRWTILEAGEIGEVLAEELESENGTFVGVVYQVENQTSEPLTLVGLELVDSADETYGYVSDALPYLDGDGCETETLEPNTVIECTAIYDVYNDAEDLQAVLTDLNMLGGEQELLDLELD